MKLVALSITAAALAIAGCASKEEKQAEVSPPSQGTGGTSSSGSGNTTRPATGDNTRGTAGGDWRKDQAMAKKSVYFDYDSNVVKDEFQPVVQSHSRLLGNQRDLKIRIEGNTDERGSREYNLALGQRRAEAVKKVMTVLGVQDARIETVSYGEEKPQSQGHDEQAWAQNRRADIKYPGE